MLEVPVIQGGMGVGISLGNLAGSVMACGGIGVISAAHPGYADPGFWQDSCTVNCQAIQREVKKARQISQGHGLLGINIMVASQDYDSYVQAACQAGVDIIFSGAGLPLSLPGLVGQSKVQLAPIISSGKALALVSRVWKKRYDRYPDLVVIEGSQAGGHLGFKEEQLEARTCSSLEEILRDVLEIVSDWPSQPPIFVGGGLWTKADLEHFQALGATGIQLGTRFITTYECDAAQAFKDVLLKADQKDLAIIKSPTGFPGRAINTEWIAAQKGKMQTIQGCIHCLKPCNPEKTPYCISRALIAAARGDVAHGLVFSGGSVQKADHMEHVKDIMDEMRGSQE